jgi:hypothetical protein
LRPIWFYFYPREATQTSSGYGYGYGSSGHGFGSSALDGTTKSSTFASKLVRKPYQEIDEVGKYCLSMAMHEEPLMLYRADNSV